jgi:hypothetical protein
LFEGKSEEDLEDLVKSFSFEDCVETHGLDVVLRADGRMNEEAKL